MIKLTSHVETVFEMHIFRLHVDRIECFKSSCWGGSSKSLNSSTSPAGCLPVIAEINSFWVCISRESRGSVVYSLVLMA